MTLQRLEKFNLSLTPGQAKGIYYTALALIISTLVVSIVLSQKSLMSSGIGNGVSAKHMVALLGGITGIAVLFASIVRWHRRGDSASSEKGVTKNVAPLPTPHSKDDLPSVDDDAHPVS